MRRLIWTPASAGVTRGKGPGVQTKPIGRRRGLAVQTKPISAGKGPPGLFRPGRGARCAKQTPFRAPMSRARGPFVRNEANFRYYADPEIGVPGGRVRQTKPIDGGKCNAAAYLDPCLRRGDRHKACL